MTINGPAAIVWAFIIAAAEKQGVPAAKLRGTIQNDILKEFQAQHAWLVPIEHGLRIVTDTMEYGAKHVPQWNTVSISGYHIREAGSTAAQELAFTLANGFEYVERGIARGMSVDEFAPRLSFFWDVHLDFFEEIAKFRAARRIWARTLKEKYGAKDPRSLLVRTHAQTAGVSLTAQQPENNIVRVAYQAMAAVLGGTQSLHTNSMDETLALPTEKAVKIALRTQQVLAYETEVAHVVDPSAGAGSSRPRPTASRPKPKKPSSGSPSAAASSKPHKRDGSSAKSTNPRRPTKRRSRRGARRSLGSTDSSKTKKRSRSPCSRSIRGSTRSPPRGCALRAKRDNARVKKALESVRAACSDGGNLMPRFVEAARAYATLGEIADVLRGEFGLPTEPAF